MDSEFHSLTNIVVILFGAHLNGSMAQIVHNTGGSALSGIWGTGTKRHLARLYRSHFTLKKYIKNSPQKGLYTEMFQGTCLLNLSKRTEWAKGDQENWAGPLKSQRENMILAIYLPKNVLNTKDVKTFNFPPYNFGLFLRLIMEGGGGLGWAKFPKKLTDQAWSFYISE